MIEDIPVKWDEMKVTCNSCGKIIYLHSSLDDILLTPIIGEYLKWCDEHNKHNDKKGYSIETYRDDRND